MPDKVRLIDVLTERFTAARMEPYRAAATGDPGLAVKLYEWNIQIGAAFFEDIGIIEVLLRNTLDRALRDHYQADGVPWYDQDEVLFDSGYKSVDVAKADVRAYLGMQASKEPDQDDVTARLGFGFWLTLLNNKSYRGRLGPIFRPCFSYSSGRPTHHEKVARAAGDLCDLRNAIAHHHPIFGWDFSASARNVSDLAGWMSPPLRVWLMRRSRVASVLNQDPLRDVEWEPRVP